VNNLVKQSLAGLRVLLVLTVLTGILYPLAVWGVGRIPGLQANAEGSVIIRNGQAVGSELIGVDPVAADPANDPWFHTRPSALAEDPLGPGDPTSSLAGNKSAVNTDYDAVVAERRTLIARREGVSEQRVPADAVTASASGLDPQISPVYAELQAVRVAKVTGIPLDTIRSLVSENTTGRGLGVLGGPAVNVLELNLAVQAAK
jgi:potassium-transporting ATPase KdpC subunit